MRLIKKYLLGDPIKRKYLNEAMSFAKDYRNSPGFKERWSKIGNKGVTRRLGSKYDPNEGGGKILWSLSNWNTSNKINSWDNSSNAAYFPSQGFYIGTNKNPVSAMSNWKDLLTHEVGHYFEANILSTYIDSYTKEKSPMGTYFSDLYPIFRKSKSYNNSLDLISDDEDIKNYERNPSYKYYDLYLGGYLDELSDSLHDGTPTESYADLFLLKKKLLDLGIYDVRKANNLFTKLHLDQFKKKNKDKVRLLDNFSDSDVIWMMNNVAQNDTPVKNKLIDYAKLGNKFRKLQLGGYVQPSNVQEAINNGSAAGGLLEGFGRVMNKILPTWLLKAGTYLSPLNYAAALSKGSINPKVGEEVISKWHPNLLLVARTGEAVFGGKAIKNTPKAVVNTAAKAGVKPAKAVVVAREINKGIKENTKNGRIEVTGNYFNSPDKWYRITETPEKYGIIELGKNVTTHDAPQTHGTINGWRSSMLRAPITKSSEGFIKRPQKIELGIRRKNGQAHGNTSQAAKGKLWGGTTSGSNLFPEGIIEGQAPSMINYGLDRTNFVMTPWELVPNGGRVGFHTGEMPMSNLGWFQRTSKGTYTYEPIIPEKRITMEPSNDWIKNLPGKRDYSMSRKPSYSGYTPTKLNPVQSKFVKDVMQGYKWGMNKKTKPTGNKDFTEELKDKERLGYGAENDVYKDTSNPDQVLKIPGDRNGLVTPHSTPLEAIKEGLYIIRPFNRLPYNLPLNIEGTMLTAEGKYIPVFSLRKVYVPLMDQPKIIDFDKSVNGMYSTTKPDINNILLENNIQRAKDFKLPNIGFLPDGTVMGIDLWKKGGKLCQKIK